MEHPEAPQTKDRNWLQEEKLRAEIGLLHATLEEKKAREPKTAAGRKMRSLLNVLQRFQTGIAATVAIVGGVATLSAPVKDYIDKKQHAAQIDLNGKMAEKVKHMLETNDRAEEKRSLFILNECSNEQYVQFFLNELLYSAEHDSTSTVVTAKVIRAMEFRRQTALFTGGEQSGARQIREINKLVYLRCRNVFDYLASRPQAMDSAYRQQLRNHILLIYGLGLQGAKDGAYDFPALLAQLCRSLCTSAGKETAEGVLHLPPPAQQWCECAEVR